jgi:hypothetical protein
LKLIPRQAAFGVSELVTFLLAIEFDTSARGARISEDPLHSVILYVTSQYVFRAMSHLSDAVDSAVVNSSCKESEVSVNFCSSSTLTSYKQTEVLRQRDLDATVYVIITLL